LMIDILELRRGIWEVFVSSEIPKIGCNLVPFVSAGAETSHQSV
jgi:hypothetical protein